MYSAPRFQRTVQQLAAVEERQGMEVLGRAIAGSVPDRGRRSPASVSPFG
jgi:hypothetical protein